MLKVNELVLSSDALLYCIYEGNPNGVAVLDDKLSFLSINTRFTQITGYSRLELKRFSFQDLVDAGDLDKFWTVVHGYNGVEPGKNGLELKLKTSGGKSSYVQLRVNKTTGSDLDKTVIVITVVDITEKKLADKALAQSEELFRKFFDNSPLGISIHDIETRKALQVNDKLASILGYSKEEMVGMTAIKISRGENDFERSENVKKLISGEISTFGTEKAYVKKDGSIVQCRTTRSLITIDDRTFLVAFVEDLSKRKEAEEKLSNREAQLRSVIDSTSDMIFSIDRDYRLTSFNKAFKVQAALIFGITLELNCPMLPDLKIAKNNPLYTEVYNYWKPLYDRALDGESFLEEQQFSYCGKKIFCQVNFNPIKTSSGKISGCTIFSRDITALKNTQGALEKSESLFRGMFEESPVAIAINSFEGEILKVNSEFIRMFGYAENEIVGKRNHSLLFPDDIKPEIRSIEKALLNSNQTSYHSVKRYIHKTGKIIWASRSSSFIRSKDNRPGFVITMLKDMTEAVRTQETILEKNKQLEAYLESNQMLENFAYIASHDLREPIRTVSNFASLLQRRFAREWDEKAQEYLKFITSGATEMHTLVEDLLFYSRVGSQKRIARNIELEKVLLLVKNNLNKVITEQNATIKISNPGIIILGNKTKLVQLFQNLISNAIKFRKKENDPVVEIEAIDNEQSWKISVKDNGIGIDNSVNGEIFQLFKKLHGKKEYEGTGIGLAVCKKIVEQHGGKIWFESNPGDGTTFHFTLQKVIKDTV